MSNQYPGPNQPYGRQPYQGRPYPGPYQQGPAPYQPPPPKKGLSGWAIAGITMGGIFVFLIALGAIVGGDTSSTAGKAGAATVSPTTANDDSKPVMKADAAPSSKPIEDETATLPEMVGKGLQSAQDQAQAAGFYSLTSHDALGRDRLQALDRNWKVCSQTPKPGSHSTSTKVDFGAVKLDEDCPDKDVAEQPKAGTAMPNFVGKSMKTARGALDSSTSITVVDASGQDRIVLVESNWQVCSQNPKAGAKLDGQPVSFEVVKFEESC